MFSRYIPQVLRPCGCAFRGSFLSLSDYDYTRFNGVFKMECCTMFNSVFCKNCTVKPLFNISLMRSIPITIRPDVLLGDWVTPSIFSVLANYPHSIPKWKTIMEICQDVINDLPKSGCFAVNYYTKTLFCSINHQNMITERNILASDAQKWPPEGEGGCQGGGGVTPTNIRKMKKASPGGRGCFALYGKYYTVRSAAFAYTYLCLRLCST